MFLLLLTYVDMWEAIMLGSLNVNALLNNYIE